MRHAHPRPQRAEAVINVHRFRAAPLLSVCLACLVLVPAASDGQTPVSGPNDVLALDPATFARWLQTGRPAPVSAEEKARILRSLPPSGEVTDLDVVQLMKLASVRRLLQKADRDSAHVVKVVDVPQAAIGLHARAVVLISETALALLTGEELQALTAHELGHEYVWDDYARAVQIKDANRIKNLELVCDAIAMVTLDRLALNPSRVISGIEKMSQFNRDRFETAVNERNYPTVAERRAFARRIHAWLSSRPPDTVERGASARPRLDSGRR